jgi:hypothetical protein
MNFNKPLIAICIGILSTIPFEIFMRITLSLGFAKYSLYQLDSLVITGNRPTAIIGFIVSSIIAGSIAFILYYALGKVGTDYIIVKSIFISLLTWSILETVVTFGFEGTRIPPRPISGYYCHFLGSMIFGLTMGFLFRRYLISDKKSYYTK